MQTNKQLNNASFVHKHVQITFRVTMVLNETIKLRQILFIALNAHEKII